jgi:glutamyl-tRNA synthetase
LLDVLSSVDDWRAATLETAVRGLAESSGVKLGQLAQPLRAALTGGTTSPPIFDVVEVLGREETLGRIKDILNRR